MELEIRQKFCFTNYHSEVDFPYIFSVKSQSSIDFAQQQHEYTVKTTITRTHTLQNKTK